MWCYWLWGAAGHSHCSDGGRRRGDAWGWSGNPGPHLRLCPLWRAGRLWQHRAVGTTPVPPAALRGASLLQPERPEPTLLSAGHFPGGSGSAGRYLKSSPCVSIFKEAEGCALASGPGLRASPWPRRRCRPRTQVSARFSSTPAIASLPPANAQLLLAEVRAGGTGDNGDSAGTPPGLGEQEPMSAVAAAAEASTPGRGLSRLVSVLRRRMWGGSSLCSPG